MAVTKQAQKLASHLENGEWEEARLLVQRVTNVKTLQNSGWTIVWNSPNVPESLVYSILCRIRVISCNYQNKQYPLGMYPFMFTRSNELWTTASAGTCRAVLRALTGSYKNQEWPRQHQCKDQLDYLWRNFLGLPHSYHQRNSGGRVEGNTEHIQQVLSIQSLQDLDNVPQVKSLWLKTVVLLKACLGLDLSYNEDEEWLVLHAIAKVECLTIVLWFATKLYPQQLSQRDENGHLPLHIAVTKPVFAEEQYVGFNEPSQWHHFRDNYPVELKEAQDFHAVFLLKAFPEGATYMNTNYRVPLLTSILSLPAQHRVRPRNHGMRFSNLQFQYTIQKCIESAPQVLCSRDFDSKLYPFQLAASVNAPLDTIYSILRSDPSSFRYRKLSKREQDYEDLLEENQQLRQELVSKDALLQQFKLKLEIYEKEKEGESNGGKRKRARK